LDSYTFSNSRTVVDAVARENVTAVYFDQRFVEQGGLISYEVDVDDIYRQAGRYAGLILKGARPSDLPVQAPTKYVLSVNLTTARTQGIGIPPDVLVLADEVIQYRQDFRWWREAGRRDGRRAGRLLGPQRHSESPIILWRRRIAGVVRRGRPAAEVHQLTGRKGGEMH